jgi:hypothetical protein
MTCNSLILGSQQCCKLAGHVHSLPAILLHMGAVQSTYINALPPNMPRRNLMNIVWLLCCCVQSAQREIALWFKVG